VPKQVDSVVLIQETESRAIVFRKLLVAAAENEQSVEDGRTDRTGNAITVVVQPRVAALSELFHLMAVIVDIERIRHR